jgi:hypothetical protein
MFSKGTSFHLKVPILSISKIWQFARATFVDCAIPVHCALYLTIHMLLSVFVTLYFKQFVQHHVMPRTAEKRTLKAGTKTE